jgi:hypothetical protein
MHSSLDKASKEEVTRFQHIYDLGCLPCRLIGINNQPCQIQHVLSGGRRVSHSYSYGSCPYHHEGIPLNGISIETMYKRFGPSRKLHKKEFTDQFGTEEELVEMQDITLNKYLNAVKI